jgi:hypothetical protein
MVLNLVYIFASIMPITRRLISKVLLACAMIFALPAISQTARIQLIHNSSDPILNDVDVWIDSLKVASNLNQRQATAFFTVPAGDSLTWYICEGGSTTPANPIHVLSGHLDAGSMLHLVIIGHIDSGAFTPYRPFELLEIAATATNVNFGGIDLRFVHGISDASILDVDEKGEGIGNVVQHLSYGSTSSTFHAYDAAFRFRLKKAYSGRVLGEYESNLNNLSSQDTGLLVVMGGFDRPDLNGQGPQVHMTLVHTSGVTDSLELANGKIQFVHNSPDPNVPRLDVYLDGQLRFNDLVFRGVSGTQTVRSGVVHHFTIAADTSTNANTPLASDSFVIAVNTTEIAVMTGAIDPSLPMFEPLSIIHQVKREAATIANRTDVSILNGAIDVPEMTLYESTHFKSNLCASLLYQQFNSYISFPKAAYTFDLLNSVTGDLFATYDFDPTQYNLIGEAVVIMTSGWADTTANGSLPALGLWIARSNSGLMTELPRSVGISTSTDRQLSVSPNPCSAVLKLQSSDPIGHIRLFDASGRMRYETHTVSHTIQLDLMPFPDGIYLLETREGDTIFRRRIALVH